jgi:hypothetical protein
VLPETSVGARERNRVCVAQQRLAELEVVALRQAAAGCVSGQLSEWPYLVAAFRRLGWEPPLDIGVTAMRGLARAALAHRFERPMVGRRILNELRKVR